VAQAEKDAAAVKKRADDLTVAAGKKSAEADEYRDKWEKMKQQVSVAKSAEREHWERAKKVSRLCGPPTTVCIISAFHICLLCSSSQSVCLRIAFECHFGVIYLCMHHLCPV